MLFAYVNNLLFLASTDLDSYIHAYCGLGVEFAKNFNTTWWA